MATVKKSKKKFVLPIVIVLVIAIIASSIAVVKVKNKGVEVSLATIATDSIVESVSATGDVTSGAVREYKVGTVATVKDVYVKVGDEVKKDQLLATFDTSGLDSEVSKLQASYNSAAKSYNNAVKNQKESKANLAKVDKEIKSVQKQIAKLQTAVSTTAASTTRTTTARVTTTRAPRPTVSIPSTTTTTTVATTTQHYNSISDALADMVATINEIAGEIKNISDSVQATNQLTQIVMGAIAQEIANGNLSSDAIADAVGDAVYDAIERGMIEFVDSGVAVEAIQAAVRAVDWAAIGAGIANDGDVKLTTLQLQLAALNAQKEIYSASSNDNIVSSQRAVMDSAKSALDTVKSAQQELTAGWKAAFDGTITECDIKAGDQTTLISSGIKLENTKKLVVTISLGEYDIHKIKVGMPARIKTAYGEYTGEVASIAPTATGGSSSSLMDSVGSMAGISGLSSLTSSGAGVKCEITVNDADENIIIGFNADVEIETGKYENVPCVPIESIVLEKEGTFVYLYDEQENTVTKTKIVTGAISDTAYEIKSGVGIGDKIVAIPSSEYKDETFEVKVK